MSYYKNRLKRFSVLDKIDQINDKCKQLCFVQTGKANERTSKISTYCGSCDTSRMIRNFGIRLLKIEKEGNKFSKGEIFYLTNHLDVLGIQKGLHQVANRLERPVWQVEAQYLIEKEKSTHHMAV